MTSQSQERAIEGHSCDDLVAGIGEVGGALASVLEKQWNVARLDVDLDPGVQQATLLHICYPFQIKDFIGTTVAYCQRYTPAAMIIHSTVLPGTTESVQAGCDGTPVYYSPVRGKHHAMADHLLHYRKYLAGPEDSFEEVAAHLRESGLKVAKMQPVKALELAKLLETTYFGVLIAWAQEVDRYAERVGSDYETVTRFIEEVPFLPQRYWPGFIGGHCVMPNIAMLRKFRPSQFLDAVQSSNDAFAREKGEGTS